MTQSTTPPDTVTVLRAALNVYATVEECGGKFDSHAHKALARASAIEAERAAIQPAGDELTTELARLAMALDKEGYTANAATVRAAIGAIAAPVCTPVQAAPDGKCDGCDPAEGFCRVCRDKEQCATEVKQDASALPPLPEGTVHTLSYGELFDGEKMRAYVLADRAARSPVAAPTEAPDSASLPPELSKAFITLEGTGSVGRSIVLKFNHRNDAYAVHDFLLKGGGKDYSAAPESAEPSADSVRLDLIDTGSLHIQTCYSESSQVPVYEICIVHGAIEDDSLQCIGTGATLREAIDIARLAISSAAKGASDAVPE